MLRDEFHWFIDNQDELVRRHNGKVLVIKNREVVGTYNSEPEAYWDATTKHELGSFLIQRCEPGRSAYTVSIHPEYAPA